ncbi:MAG: MATE family efflux transporter, partial [Parasporobacterium sp.]|nr:MATE family efflux transporter [Parasporobacterium sp.]
YTVISSGAAVVMGQKIGARKTDEASDAAFCSLLFISLLGLTVSAALSLNARRVMMLMNITGEVLDEAEVYFRIVIRFSFLSGINSVIFAIFRTSGRPKISVMINMIMNIINAVLNCLVVFRPFDFPLKGISGIGWSYALSLCCASLISFIVFIRIPSGISFRGKGLRTLRNIRQILIIGIPGGISSFSYSISQVVTTSMIAALGVTAISTKIYVSNLVYYVYVLGMSLGSSTSLMISWLAGAGLYDQAYRLNLQNLKITAVLNGSLSSLLFLFGFPLLGMFTDDPAILSAGRTLLAIDIFVEIFRGFNHIEEFSLRGAGDVVYPMIVASASCWIMSVGFAWLLGIHLGFGLAGCWFAFGLDEMTRGVSYLLRWRSRKWIAKTVH